MSNKSFRLDIQGLRAIAVLSVVIFHIAPSALPGGFIGVDVFFVISGYLIMGHIWRDLNHGSFQLLTFYAKRVRRLFPALFTTLVLSSLLSYIFFWPAAFESFSQSLSSSLLYVSNFWFYTKSGYFDGELQNSPLLHTWSLSVEEQFYILFPIALVFMHRVVKSKALLLLGIFAIISLVFSEALLHYNESMSYYATPSRFWQFIVGGVLGMRQFKLNLSKITSDVIALACMLVLALCTYFTSSKGFPGFNALLPTFATAVILSLNLTSGFSFKLLANPLSCFFGNISYSLYLWHWPVIVFYKLKIAPDLRGVDNVFALLISIVFAYLSYQFVESVAKNVRLSVSPSRVLALSSAISILLIVVVYFVAQANYSRFTIEQRTFESYLNYPQTEFRSGVCFLNTKSNDFSFFKFNECIKHNSGKRNVVLIGDSHAAHWYGPLKQHEKENETLSQVTSSGCKPTLRSGGEKRCVDLMEWAYEKLLPQNKFDLVILSARWEQKDTAMLRETLKYLKTLSQDILVLGPVVEYDAALPSLLLNEKNENEIFKHSKYSIIKNNDLAIAKEASQAKVRYVSVLDAICPNKTSCITNTNGIPLQFDYGHLTQGGGMYLLNKIQL